MMKARDMNRSGKKMAPLWSPQEANPLLSLDENSHPTISLSTKFWAKEVLERYNGQWFIFWGVEICKIHYCWLYVLLKQFLTIFLKNYSCIDVVYKFHTYILYMKNYLPPFHFRTFCLCQRANLRQGKLQSLKYYLSNTTWFGQIQKGEKLFASENGAKITLYSVFINMIIVMDFVNCI